MKIPLTLLYAGLNVLLVTLLGLEVSRRRLALGVYLDHAVPPEMTRAVRAHGNATEWVPLVLVLLLALELAGAPAVALHLVGAGLLVARVLHAVGALAKLKLSTAGATLTYLVAGLASLYAVYLAVV